MPNLSVDYSGNFCDDGAWHGDSTWTNGLPLNNSTLNLSKISDFLKGKQKIFVSINHTFNYDGNNYEYTLIENTNNYFVDVNM